MIPRILHESIQTRIFKGKAILIMGPRQSGKTTLLKRIASDSTVKTLFLNCDEPNIRKRLQDVSSSALKSLIGPAKMVLIDEAQRVENIGLTLKLIIDQIAHVQVIATGSSAFDLANRINEPLTGRKYELFLLPIATQEMVVHTNFLEEERHLEQRLIYGMYPDVINHPGEEQEILQNLSDSYLYKDVLAFRELRRPEVLEKLLEALALQVASEVSFNELARLLQIDSVTVQRYIEILEKTFVVFRLCSFSRNVRNELKKSRKIYFYDNGVRNAIIFNFNPPALRSDIGYLWENFVVSERLKWLNNQVKFVQRYFWRTTQQQEIDYIEESDGKMLACEFKWSAARQKRFPKTFLNAYPESKTTVVTPENYMEFLQLGA
ncbi:MAG: ATP-binding protein [bacterium]